MNLPQVFVNFSNGNLNQSIAVIDGEAAFVGSASTIGNYNQIFTINSLADAITQGITQTAEPEAYRQLSEFYGELAGNQECFLMLFSPEITMTMMLDWTDATKANALITAGKGKIAYLGLFKTAAEDYAGAGTSYLDEDVAAAVLASKAFTTAWNKQGYFFRTLVGGYVNNESSTTIYAPNTSTNGFAGVLLASSQPDKGSSVGLALGRKVKYACNIKMGKTQNGPIQATAMYIGTKPIEQVANLDALAGDGYIVPVTYPNKAGYYWGVDNMASQDDYRLMVWGATVDAGARVTFDYYTDWLESETDVDDNGGLLPTDAQHLQDNITSQIKSNLGARISGVVVNIPTDQTIVPGSTFIVQLRIRPTGYFTFINIDLGLTA